MSITQKYTILIVDDEEWIRRILCDLFKGKGYLAHAAKNGQEALEFIEQHRPQMVISDIQMPVMDGFELFRKISLHYPEIKHVLMTSYDIDQYISLVRKHNIGNILVKGADFSLGEVSSYVQSLLTGEIFGLERFFPNLKLNCQTIHNYRQAKEICSTLSRKCLDTSELFLEIAIDELVSNAVFHGVLQMTGVPREQWHEDYEISPEDAIKITWVYDNEKIGVAVEDPKGRLKKVDVLHWLDHDGDEPRGGEEHGRGFLLVRKLIDRFIININPGKRTECIVIQYFDRKHVHHKKPLLIHEL